MRQPKAAAFHILLKKLCMSTTASLTNTWRPNPILGLLSCILAAGLAYLVIDQVHPSFPFADLPEMGPYPSAELVAQYTAAEYEFQTKNSAVNCAILGALVGLFVGLFTATNRVLGGIVLALIGAVAGLAGGYVAGNLAAAAIVKAGEQSLLQSVGYLSLVWGLIAGTLCATLIGLHNKSKALSGLMTGVIVGILGALTYNMITSIVSPMSNLVLITPKETGERLIWALSFGAVLGIGVAFGFRNVHPSARKNAADQELVDVA